MVLSNFLNNIEGIAYSYFHENSINIMKMNFVNKNKMQENSEQYYRDCKMILHHKEVFALFEELIHEPWGYEKWRPLIDIIEQEDLFVIKADLPGVSAENLKVSATDTKVLIEGNRISEEMQANTKVHICERPKGKFVREIDFFTAISPSNIETHLENGVLIIKVKKQNFISD